MNKAKREALQAAGFQIGTVQDFLGLTDLENRLLELKYGLSTIAKRRRLDQDMTQHDVAKLIHSSQSRVAKMEAGSKDTSIDLLVRYLFAVGGNLSELAEIGSKVQPHPKKNAGFMIVGSKAKKERKETADR